VSPVGSPPGPPPSFDVERLVAAQHPGGAFPAGAEFSQYGQSWLRDGSFIAHALDVAGRHDSAARFHGWVARTVARLEGHVDDLIARRSRGEPIDDHELLPARFTLEGEWERDGWPNFQLDGYGQWLWSLAAHLRETGRSELPDELERGVRVTVRYLQAFWDRPCYDAWEEHRSQLHTSTLASVHAGMRDIARWVPEAATTAKAALGLVLEECVVDGTLVKHVKNTAVDASLLWLAVPFEVFPVDDPVMRATVARVEAELLGGGLRRYAADTYYGGGEWVLLTAWLAWYNLRAGRRREAERLLAWVEAQRDETGALPEQVPGEDCHPWFLRYWTREWGPSARPLLWSHAMVVLAKAELERATRGEGGEAAG